MSIQENPIKIKWLATLLNMLKKSYKIRLFLTFFSILVIYCFSIGIAFIGGKISVLEGDTHTIGVKSMKNNTATANGGIDLEFPPYLVESELRYFENYSSNQSTSTTQIAINQQYSGNSTTENNHNNTTKNDVKNNSNTRQGNYVASKSGKYYYTLNCSGINRIKEENRVYFTSADAAILRGYTLAKSCK